LDRLRRHGYAPFHVAVLHGGPGAPGSAYGLAKGLGEFCGVVEPFQTTFDVEGLLAELHDQVRKSLDLPAILIGHSWGAWLGFLFAAKHPTLVQKLILVSSGPFDESYVPMITKTRLERLGPEGRKLFEGLLKGGLSDAQMKKVGEHVARADAYDPLPPDAEEKTPPNAAQYESVWGQASAMRQSGVLLDAAQFIRCPVVAIHGDWDPHPAEGVRVPLEKALKDFKMVLLEKCGHEPWRERQAREAFFRALHREI